MWLSDEMWTIWEKHLDREGGGAVKSRSSTVETEKNGRSNSSASLFVKTEKKLVKTEKKFVNCISFEEVFE